MKAEPTLNQTPAASAITPRIEIKHRDTGDVLRVVEAKTLRGADLGGADLRGADLDGADLGGADLGGVKIDSAQADALLAAIGVEVQP